MSDIDWIWLVTHTFAHFLALDLYFPWFLLSEQNRWPAFRLPRETAVGTGQTSGGCAARGRVWRRTYGRVGKTWRPLCQSAPSSRLTRGFCFEKVWKPSGPGNNPTGPRACFSLFFNFNDHIPTYLYHLGQASLQIGIMFRHEIRLTKKWAVPTRSSTICYFFLILPFRSFYIFCRAKLIFSNSGRSEL